MHFFVDRFGAILETALLRHVFFCLAVRGKLCAFFLDRFEAILETTILRHEFFCLAVRGKLSRIFFGPFWGHLGDYLISA